MSENKQRYIYAGRRYNDKGKLFHILVKEGDESEVIAFSDRKRQHYIGGLFLVTHLENERFRKEKVHEDLKKQYPDLVKRWTVDTIAAKQAHKEYHDKKNLETMRERLDHMTMNEIKKYADTIGKKRLIRKYLEEVLW